jgi:hypothetical protein
MASGSFNTIRNFVIPYVIYCGLTFAMPAPLQEWMHRVLPGLELSTIDLKKIILPFAALVVVHYLFDRARRALNAPFFNRVNGEITGHFVTEFGAEYGSWNRIRPAFYHVVDSDKSLTVLSDRIRNNGLVWFGFTDLRLASSCGG